MRILVYPHDLGTGGSQLNAIEIAAAVRDAGHSVVVFGRPGPLVRRVEELDLEFIESPDPGRRPSRRVVGRLTELIDERGIELLHGYEWPPILECAWAARRRNVVAVGTVMSMAVAPFIPFPLPLVVGTEQIGAVETRAGRTAVSVIEPPVDLSSNYPGAATDVDEFRRTHGIDPGRTTVVTVTRLAHEMKLEGILAAIDVVETLSADLPIQLVIVGDGPARAEVEARARAVNDRTGHDTIVLTGNVFDPRPAYDLADVTLAMGGSALRSMAFGKPLVVQGEQGFWSLLTPDTLPDFEWSGWYGVGPGPETGQSALTRGLAPLLSDPARRAELGEFGRAVVERRFSLEVAVERQLAIYRSALAAPAAGSGRRTDAVATAKFVSYHLRRRLARVLGSGRLDDFNAEPVLARPDAVARPS